jgi:hypothetical protein
MMGFAFAFAQSSCAALGVQPILRDAPSASPLDILLSGV